MPVQRCIPQYLQITNGKSNATKYAIITQLDDMYYKTVSLSATKLETISYK